MKKIILVLTIIISLGTLAACKNNNSNIKDNTATQITEKKMYNYDVSFVDEERSIETDDGVVFATLIRNDVSIHCDENEEAAEKMMDYLRDKSNMAWSEAEMKADSFRFDEKIPNDITFEVLLELFSMDEDKTVFTLTEKSTIDGDINKKINEYYFDSQTGNPIESLNKE